METYRERMKRIKNPLSPWPYDICDHKNKNIAFEPHPEMINIFNSKMNVSEKIAELDSKIWSKADLDWVIYISKGKILNWAIKEREERGNK